MRQDFYHLPNLKQPSTAENGKAARYKRRPAKIVSHKGQGDTRVLDQSEQVAGEKLLPRGVEIVEGLVQQQYGWTKNHRPR